ncbi:hypothetical protein DFH08DRAFT_1018964 [Mycena albidolilacea]|uniref:Uncharacterized protein n=1 Tax=Mycena albidolilacea TaxID=1033008 RepID=A0AAD6ZS16_9AGAR|nr:hypothetical protein DFH08DRAFT_1018964 [Mycena albidolilacea]
MLPPHSASLLPAPSPPCNRRPLPPDRLFKITRIRKYRGSMCLTARRLSIAHIYAATASLLLGSPARYPASISHPSLSRLAAHLPPVPCFLVPPPPSLPTLGFFPVVPSHILPSPLLLSCCCSLFCSLVCAALLPAPSSSRSLRLSLIPNAPQVAAVIKDRCAACSQPIRIGLPDGSTNRLHDASTPASAASVAPPRRLWDTSVGFQ